MAEAKNIVCKRLLLRTLNALISVKMKLSFFISSLLILVGFQSLQSSTIFVKIQTESKTDTAIFITERALSGVDLHRAYYAGKNSELAVALPFDISMQAKLIYKRKSYPLYINGGDSLWIDFVQGKPNFKGKKASENAALYAFLETFSTYYLKDSLRKKIFTTSIDEFEIGLFDQRKLQLTWIEKQEITSECKSILTNYSTFWYWYSIYSFPIERANASPQNPVIPLPKIVLDGFPLEELNNPRLLSIEPFRELLYYYITYLTSESNGFSKFADSGTSTERKTAQINAHLKGEVAVYAASRFFAENLQKISEPVGKRLLELIEEKDATRMYFKFLQPAFKSALASSTAKNLPREQAGSAKKTDPLPYSLKDLNGKVVTLNDFKGKILYVDFWASWCGPCRQMFPFSRKLHESLSEKQKKEIAFLYISIDGDEESWKKGVEQLELNYGINMISPGNWQSEIVKYFQINSIPRYMIFDKKGNLIDSNAKRPADPNLLSELLLLLEK